MPFQGGPMPLRVGGGGGGGHLDASLSRGTMGIWLLHWLICGLGVAWWFVNDIIFFVDFVPVTQGDLSDTRRPRRSEALTKVVLLTLQCVVSSLTVTDGPHPPSCMDHTHLAICIQNVLSH